MYCKTWELAWVSLMKCDAWFGNHAPEMSGSIALRNMGGGYNRGMVMFTGSKKMMYYQDGGGNIQNTFAESFVRLSSSGGDHLEFYDRSQLVTRIPLPADGNFRSTTRSDYLQVRWVLNGITYTANTQPSQSWQNWDMQMDYQLTVWVNGAQLYDAQVLPAVWQVHAPNGEEIVGSEWEPYFTDSSFNSGFMADTAGEFHSASIMWESGGLAPAPEVFDTLAEAWFRNKSDYVDPDPNCIPAE
jgi:hypothetical protein